MWKSTALFCCWLMFLMSACSEDKRSAAREITQSEPPSNAALAKPIDPCSLVTAEEIAKVLGEVPKGMKRIDETEGGLAVAQCFYELPTYSNSVSVRVVQMAAGADARNPRDVWEETFAPAKLTEAGSRAPEPVPGVGDAAFWRSHRKGGALYVLHGNVYLRIGAEGAEEKETKIVKCSEIAHRALSRL